MTQDNGISIGVLIIGSLYWDPSDNRQNWRSERLNLGTKKYVSAPIRYGRRSKCRGNSYTMVFSMNLCEEQFGRAIVVPCKQRVKSICDLLEEAKFLWMAESGHLGPVSAKWGCVAVVENPDRPIPDDLREGWAERVSRESCYGQLKSAVGEEVVVNESGFLKIPWPKSEDDSDLTIDALLATATNPTIVDSCYPSARDIAEAWNTPKGKDHVDYFCKNRAHGIKTFQDSKIEGCLSSLW